MHSALCKKQRQDEALSKLIQWIEKGEVPTPHEMQGFAKARMTTQQSIQKFMTPRRNFVSFQT